MEENHVKHHGACGGDDGDVGGHSGYRDGGGGWRCRQCVQIGRFMNGLGNKFAYKNCPSIWLFGKIALFK